MKRLSLIGQRFGRLTVTAAAGSDHNGKTTWRVECGCGKVLVAVGSRLRDGQTKSCGCLQRDTVSKRNHKHGLSHSPEHKIWRGIIARCENSNEQSFQYYGARGIKMHPEWRDDFMAFLRDIGPRPSSRHEIDRIDVNGNYAPGNVRWTLPSIQRLNQRRTKQYTANGKTMSMSEWAKETGISVQTISARLARGWSHEEAVTKKVA